MFHIVKKSQNLNHQSHCGHKNNGDSENVSEEPSEEPTFIFLIVKPVAKLGVRFLKIENFTKAFAF